MPFSYLQLAVILIAALLLLSAITFVSNTLTEVVLIVALVCAFLGEHQATFRRSS